MRIFELTINHEKEWLYAESALHALRFYSVLTDVELSDYDLSKDSIEEVPPEKWPEMFIFDEYGGKESFDQWVSNNKQSYPEIIGGTMYYEYHAGEYDE